MAPHSEDDLVETQDMMEETMEGTAGEAAAASSKAKKTKNKKSAKRRKLFFESSALSEADRRVIRKDQRDLHESIAASSNTEDLQAYRKANNDLYERGVFFTREAVLDAENNLLLATKMVQNAERLVQVPTFDAMKLMQKLARQCDSDGGFMWKTLGQSCGVCFNAVPERVSFLAGPLDAELPEKKAKARAERKKREPVSKVAEVELKQVKDQEEEDEDDKANRLSACEKTRKDMKSVLRKKTKKSNAADICGLHYLLNPKSFTQSVENIFTFSFLIKNGEATIGVREHPGLGDTRGLYVAPRILSSETDMQSKQSVVSFTMRDWKRLCDGYHITEGDLPHRATKVQRRQAD